MREGAGSPQPPSREGVAKLSIPEAGRHRRFALAFLALAVAGVLSIAGLNLLVNPRGEFETDAFLPLVADQPSRSAELLEVAGRDGPPQTLVLGSSRAQMLPPGNDSFNFAIPAGGIRDTAAAYDFVQRTVGTPHRVVLGLDSFQLTTRDYEDSALERSRAGERILGHPIDRPPLVVRLAGTLSTDYLYSSVRVLGLTALSEFDDPLTVQSPTGQSIWVRDEKARAAGTFDLEDEMERSWKQYIRPRYPADAAVDADAVAAATALIDRILADGARLEVVLLPFHPTVLERLKEVPSYGPLYQAAFGLARDACADGASVHDFSRIDAFGGTADGFYDGHHLAPENARLVMAALDEPDDCPTPA